MNENLGTAYHQQDTDYYCGAACVQMVLDSIGAGTLDQNSLYADNHSHSTIEPGWYTAPDGLQWTLNDRRPSTFANWFALFALANEYSISRKICWTIHHYQVAPVAMVYGSAHWIVVRGFDASAAPAGSSDTSYSITAFDVNNPWPPTPTGAAEPPHSGGDGCGAGGMRGVANEHITYATWQADYMTGIPGGYWSGKFVAVCDPEPPAERPGNMRRPEKRLRGERLISSEEAAKSARRGVEEYGLYERKEWKKALLKSEPERPVLVQRLDHLDHFYYIVPLGAGPKRIKAAVVVDARFGQYRQAAALPERGSNLFTVLDGKAALDKVIGKRFELGNRLGRLLIRKEAFCLYPHLVWKPCRESLSPFYPFHMLTSGAHRIYIRIDGEVFTTLHDDDRGI
jgi:hypothetical protein